MTRRLLTDRALPALSAAPPQDPGTAPDGAQTVVVRHSADPHDQATEQLPPVRRARLPGLSGAFARGARHARRFTSSVRTRIVFGYVALLALAIVASFLVAREILLVRLDDRVDAELVQETRELSQLASGNDPETGEPFAGRVERIFDVYFARNVPGRNEALLTFVDGSPYRSSLGQNLAADPLRENGELIRRWGAITEPQRATADTPEGPIDYQAVPLELDGRTLGVFVVAIFRDRERAEVDDAVRAVGGVGLATLVVGALLFWRLGDGVLVPVRAVTRMARSISETDLSRRIHVQGEDEVAELSGTFNEMLDRLEAAFALQRQFLDDAGHELRTPITIIRGHLELLGDDPDERQQTIALVMDELDRVSRMVNDLLLLAASQQPNFLELTTVDVEELTRELVAKSEALAPRAWRLDGIGRGVVVADRQRLTQALVQLADNAVRHTTPTDVIALGSKVEDGEASFSVRDTGTGIPLEEQEAVFGRFTRGSSARRSDGAGLGLAIVRAIAEAHHGRVELDSRPGEGTTVTLVIPVDQPAPDGELP